MTTEQLLHEKFNPRSDQIPPVRIKRFRRGHIYNLFAELGYLTGAEIGVAEGYNSRAICQANPQLIRHYCVDLWDTYYRGYAKLKDRAMQDDAFRQAQENLSPYSVEFIRESSATAHRHIIDASLDYVYIDGDHSYDFVMTDLIWWARKVKPGGIIAGHDYYRFRGAGVVDAVNDYTRAHQINEWFVTDEHEVSFFWAQQIWPT